MKLCPECRRDYNDSTLIYCLDDGARLVEGPGSEETSTAIMHGLPGEAPTMALAERRNGRWPSTRYSVIAGVLGIVLIAALGVGSYWYYGRSDAATIDSIAVMPFVNEGQDPDLEYLSDGMTDTLINNLSRIPKLSVKARSSVFRYKGMDVESQKVAAELNVQAIVNGRVLQRGDDLTLNLEMVDARTRTVASLPDLVIQLQRTAPANRSL
jgi:TolB-like protein